MENWLLREVDYLKSPSAIKQVVNEFAQVADVNAVVIVHVGSTHIDVGGSAKQEVNEIAHITDVNTTVVVHVTTVTCQYFTTEDPDHFSPLASVFVNEPVQARRVIL